MLEQPWVSALGQGLWYKQAKKLADMNSRTYYKHPRTYYKQTRTDYNNPITYYREKNKNVCSYNCFLNFKYVLGVCMIVS